MNLLMVNDEIITVQSMRDKIDWESYKVTSISIAFNALKAKELLKNQKFDILLCDIEMPGESGIDLLRWARKEQIQVECIFLTCHANFAYAQEALKLGCQDYVLMPARYEEIGQSVLSVVNRINKIREEQNLQEFGKVWISSKTEEAIEKQGNRRSTTQIVNDCMSYIISHLDHEDLSINAVAANCYLSPIYVNRIFKKETGDSIGQVIIRKRMELAAQLLANPEINANAVAAQVGYMNYPHFSTTFKKYYGYSPQQFKDKY